VQRPFGRAAYAKGVRRLLLASVRSSTIPDSALGAR
jgi:hypothetical protein